MNTKITKRIIIMTAGMLVLASGAALGADGDGGDAPVEATITAGLVGHRSVLAATASPMSSALDASTLTGTLNVVVDEVARAGTATGWDVTAILDADLSDGGTNSIPRNQMTLTPGSVVQVAGGGSSDEGSAGTLDSAVTLFSNTGQSASAVYTGTYTQAASGLELAIPNGTATGVYTGNISITLFQ